MTIYDFMILGNEEQMAQVMLHGTLVAKLCVNQNLYVLYSLNNFYFELQYHGENSKSTKQEALLVSRHIFQSGARMEKYLKSDFSL